jgi:hypothetical protein
VVADGAGSKALSRVGASVSAEGAANFLAERLTGGMGAPGLTELLAEAAGHARSAVSAAAAARQDSEEHRAVCGGIVTVEDLSATLLLVVWDGRTLATLQVGDGAILGVGERLDVVECGKAISGQYAGETEFLTTFQGDFTDCVTVVNDKFSSVLIMTDGVSDDYFPLDPGGRRLAGDLILNGVLPLADIAGETAYRGTVCSIEGPDGARELEIASAISLAEQVGRTAEEVLASPLLLAAGRLRGDRAPEANLLDWLEGNTVRGSFDDRTLVVLVISE